MKIGHTLLALLAVGLTSQATATDTINGQALHEAHCAGCHMLPHDTAFYSRPERKMDSKRRLEAQVRFCDANLGTQLFDEDILAITDYLNTSHYHFK